MINVFYTERFFKPDANGVHWRAGFVFGPLIFIRPKYRDDVGLLAHEQEHVRQFWRTFCLHGLFYHFSPKYRLQAEAEAYAVQLHHSPVEKQAARLKYYADFIATRYKLKVTQAEAEAAILEFL